MVEFLFVVIVITIGVVVYFLFFDQKAQIKRKIGKIKIKKIAEVIDGETVRIKGKIVFYGTTLKAPFSGRPCSYYHIKLTRHSGRNKYTVIDEEKAGDVVIQDGNNFAVISTMNSQSYINIDKTYSSGFLQNPNKQLLEFLEDRLIDNHNILGLNKTLDYYEGILGKGELIAVAGKASWVNKNQFSYDLPCDKVLLIESKIKGNPIHFSDVGEIVYQR